MSEAKTATTITWNLVEQVRDGGEAMDGDSRESSSLVLKHLDTMNLDEGRWTRYEQVVFEVIKDKYGDLASVSRYWAFSQETGLTEYQDMSTSEMYEFVEYEEIESKWSSYPADNSTVKVFPMEQVQTVTYRTKK